MTAEVLIAPAKWHNARAAAEFEYEQAKDFYDETLAHRNPLNDDHNRRFGAAVERVMRARERYLELL